MPNLDPQLLEEAQKCGLLPSPAEDPLLAEAKRRGLIKSEQFDPLKGVEQIPNKFATSITQTEPPIKRFLGTAADLPIGQGVEQTMLSINKLLGKAKSPYADKDKPYAGPHPLTPEEQKYESQPEILKPISTAGRTIARAGVGAATFIPSLLEKMFLGEDEKPTGKPQTNIESFMNTLPSPVKTAIHEAIGLGKMTFDALIDLDYSFRRAAGRKDPAALINPDNPFVRAFEGVTGKSFKEYYENTVNEFYEGPEALPFGMLIGKGVGRGVAKKALPKAETMTEQGKRAFPPEIPQPERFAEFETKVKEISPKDKPAKVIGEYEKKQESLERLRYPVETGFKEKPRTVKLEPEKKPGEVTIIPDGKKVLPKAEKPVKVESKPKNLWEMTKDEISNIPVTKFGEKYLQQPQNPLKSRFIRWFKDKVGNDISNWELSTYKDGEPYFKHISGTEISLRQYIKDYPELAKKPKKPPKPIKKPLIKKPVIKGKEPWELTKEEFDRDFEYHGSQAIIKGGKLELGQAMGGDAGGIFTTKTKSLANEFVSGKGKLHRVDIRGRKILDLTKPESIKLIEKQIGEKYIVNDATGETGLFTREHFDFLFPEIGGKRMGADWATFDSYTPLFEKMGFDAVRLWENTAKEIKTTAFFKGGLKVFEESHKKIIEDAISEGKPIPPEVLKDYPELVKKVKPKALPKVETPKEAVKVTEIIKPEEDIVGLNKIENENIRKYTGLNKLPQVERISFKRSLSEAKEQKLDKSALETADEILKSDRPITANEHAGMVIKVGELMDKYDSAIENISKAIDEGNKGRASVERTRANIALEHIEKLTEATKSGRTEAARTMSIGRMMLSRDNYGIVHVLERAKSSKGMKLTNVEKAKFEELVQKHKNLKNELKVIEDKYTKTKAEREKIVAEQVAKKLRIKSKIRQRGKVSKENILSQRKDIKKEIAALGFRVNDITGVTAEGSFLIGKLAVNYIKEGVAGLDAVVKKVISDIPEITDVDVYRALMAKDPKKVAKLRNITSRKISLHKTQSRILLELENAKRGIFKEPKKIAEYPNEIKAQQKIVTQLRKRLHETVSKPRRLEKALETINTLQDQLDNMYRSVKKKKPVDSGELADAKSKIKALRKDIRLDDTIADLKEQLRTGDFKISRLERPAKLPKDLEKKQVEVKLFRKDIKGEIEKMSPVTFRGTVAETVNTLRTLKATADMSYTLRQGLVLSVNHPITATKAFAKAFKAAFGKYSAERLDVALRSVDHHYLREQAGLFLPEVREGRINAREEMFMSNLAEKIPVLGAIVKASERHMITGLNHLRAGVFDQFLEKYPNATTAELKAWANWVNVASGRGDLGKVSGIANELSVIFFAPRFAISRVQTPFMAFKHWKEPRIRKAIAKELATFGGLGLSALALADLAGFKVSADPREADFGKIRIGNTRIDMWGGIQQPMRLIASSIISISDKAGVTGRHLPYSEINYDPVEAFGRFSSYKLSPIITIGKEVWTGRSIVGEEVTPSETALRAIIPMVYEDIADAYKEDGVAGALIYGGLNFFGTATNTYSDSEAKTRKDIRKLLDNDNTEVAEQKKIQWNMRNPDNRIINVSKTKNLGREPFFGESTVRLSSTEFEDMAYKMMVDAESVGERNKIIRGLAKRGYKFSYKKYAKMKKKLEGE